MLKKPLYLRKITKWKRILVVLTSTSFLASCGIASLLEDEPLEEPRLQSETGPNTMAGFSRGELARYTSGYGGFLRATEATFLIREAASDAFSQEISAMRGGDANLYDVSSAALRLFTAQDAIISLRNKILQNRLDLYVALGDDYFDGDTT